PPPPPPSVTPCCPPSSPVAAAPAVEADPEPQAATVAARATRHPAARVLFIGVLPARVCHTRRAGGREVGMADMVVFGYVAESDSDASRERMVAFAVRLAKLTGLEVVTCRAHSYTELAELVHKDKVDFARLPPIP